jgi:DNA-binding CsgD family transcriptional regulator/tetratricopeptide (TPR) repeat protein
MALPLYKGSPIHRLTYSPAHRLIREHSEPHRNKYMHTLIARQNQLQLLNSELALAQRGQGRVILLAGEAGVGKTRLMQAFVDQLEKASGLEVLIGHCYDLRPAAPYGPFVELVRLLAEAHGYEPLRSRLGPWAGDLQRLLPELAPLNDSSVLDEQSDKPRLFEAIVRALRPHEPERCRILIIEDLHWSDPTSQELFHYLARAIEREAILLIGTYRSDEIHRLHPLGSLLARLSRDRLLREIRLQRLSRGELAQLVHSILEREPPTRFVDALYERTEGNPFFAEEVIDSLCANDHLDGLLQAAKEGRRLDEFALPLSIRESVMRRAADLDPTTIKVVRAAAVVGRSFTFELLALLMPLSEEELLAALRQLVERQLIIEERGHDDQYSFRHELIRQTLNDDLLRRERRLQHRNVLTALEQLYNGKEELVIDQLAYHSLRARDSERTLRYSQQAGDRAVHMHAYREALGHYEAALEAGEGLTIIERAGLLERLGHAAYALREQRVVSEAWTEARDLYAQLGHVRQQADLIRWLGRLAWEQGDSASAFVQVRAALALLEHETPCREKAIALSALSQLHMLSHEYEASINWGTQALSLAEELNDQQVIAHALNNLGTSRTSLGDGTQGLADLRRSLQIARDNGLVADALRAYVNLGGRLHEVGKAREAQQVLLEGAAYAQATGWEQHNANLLLNLGATEYELGEWDLTLQRTNQLITFFGSVHIVNRSIALAQQAHILLQRGQIDDAERLYIQSKELAPADHATALLVLGFEIARARNDLPAIDSFLEQLLASLDGYMSKKPHYVPDYINIVRVLYERGQVARADQLINIALERAERFPNHHNTMVGTLLQGIRALHTGDRQAVHYFAQATELLDRENHGPGHCFTLRMQATALLQSGRSEDQEAARRLLREARSIAETIGMELDLRQLDLLEQRLAPQRPAERPLDALTPREVQVLELIRQGQSNRAIAETLVISEKTAEVHVRNILSKLGVASRTQAAVRALEMGLQE